MILELQETLKELRFTHAAAMSAVASAASKAGGAPDMKALASIMWAVSQLSRTLSWKPLASFSYVEDGFLGLRGG